VDHSLAQHLTEKNVKISAGSFFLHFYSTFKTAITTRLQHITLNCIIIYSSCFCHVSRDTLYIVKGYPLRIILTRRLYETCHVFFLNFIIPSNFNLAAFLPILFGLLFKDHSLQIIIFHRIKVVIKISLFVGNPVLQMLYNLKLIYI